MLLSFGGCAREADDSIQDGEETISAENQEESPHFIKAEIGSRNEYENGAFVLDNLGQLYFYSEETENLDLIEKEVQDFSNSQNNLYLLKQNGDLLETGFGGYQEDVPLKTIFHHDDAVFVSNSMLLLSDGSVIQHHFDTDSWNPVNISAKKITANYSGSAIIDENNTLWHFDRFTEKLTKVADHVIDCDYSDKNKIHYSDDIWYIDEDHTLHLVPSYDTGNPSNLPNSAVSVDSGASGYFLAQQPDSTYIFGNYGIEDFMTELKIKGICADISAFWYIILDEDYNLHYGKIAPPEGVIFLENHKAIEERLISHP